MIYAEEAGWCHEVRYQFNDAVTAYVERFERMRDAFVEKDAPRPPRTRGYKKRVPKHSEAELLAYLGISPEDKQAQQIIEQAIPDEAWDTLDDGEWLSVPETVA